MKDKLLLIHYSSLILAAFSIAFILSILSILLIPLAAQVSRIKVRRHKSPASRCACWLKDCG
jgi:hypothetical protein